MKAEGTNIASSKKPDPVISKSVVKNNNTNTFLTQFNKDKKKIVTETLKKPLSKSK